MEHASTTINRSTEEPPIKDTPIEDKPLNKGQSVFMHSNLQKEDNLSTKDKRLGPKCVHYLEVPSTFLD